MSRFEATVDGLQRRQGELMRTQMQMTSGTRVNLPSDDPTAAARIERSPTAQLRVASEQRSVDVSRNAMQLAESALGQTGDVLHIAREVMVASLATVYAVAASSEAIASQALSPLIAQDWSPATGLSLLVWFIYAPQCISTLATIKRETHSWKQTAFATVYLFALAYFASLITYRVAVAMGGG